MTTGDRRPAPPTGAEEIRRREKRRKEENKLDAALAATFPASDPVAAGTAMGGPRAKKPVLPGRERKDAGDDGGDDGGPGGDEAA